MALGEDRVRRGVVGFEGEELVEAADGSQAAVDGSDDVAGLLAVLDEGVDVGDADLGGPFGAQAKKSSMSLV